MFYVFNEFTESFRGVHGGISTSELINYTDLHFVFCFLFCFLQGGVLLRYLAILFHMTRSPIISPGNDEVDAKSGVHEESVGEEVK